MMRLFNSNSGFSLLELSVVLMVIALLAGGVMVGKDLIRQSAVRSVVGDVERIKSAVDSFKNIYGALPGDMTNATDIWGTAAACPPTVDFTGTATCNGNGNGRILMGDATTPPNPSLAPEWFYSWHHLSNAKLIEGSYTGRPGSGGVRQAVPGVNVYAGRMRNTGFTLDGQDIVVDTHGSYWSGYYTVMLHFGSIGTGHTFGRVLTPEEAYRIDEKMDDGRPGLGVVRAYKDPAMPGTTQNCTEPNAPMTAAQKYAATYERQRAARSCNIYFTLTGDPG